MSELAFFAINLDRSPHRWVEIKRLFGAMPWPLERVAAVDVRKPDEVLAVRGQKLDMPPNGIGWNPLRNRMFALVEEACFASHMLALKAFLASGHDHAVILEDDAVPLDGFAETMRRLLASGVAFDIIKMEGIVRGGGRLSVPVADLGAAKLVRSMRPSSGGAGYLVTRKAAEQLLARAGKLAVPVDDFISNAGLHGCDVMHTSPWLIAQAGADTTMGDLRTPHRHVKRRDPFHFLQQGFVRGSLRVQLWLNAMHGSPLSLLKLYTAPWSPVDVGQQMRRLAAGGGSMMAATLPDAGYSATPLAAKLGLKDGQSVVFVNLPDDLQGLATARDFSAVAQFDWAALGDAGERHDIVHAFTGKRADLEGNVETFKKMIAPDGAVWISWPKKAAKIATDITEDVIRDVVLPNGLVDVKVCAVDAVWSGLKLVIRKELRAKL